LALDVKTLARAFASHEPDSGFFCMIFGLFRKPHVNQNQRPVLQAARIADFLDSHSRLFRRTRERLTRKLGEKLMRAQGKLGTEARNLWE